MKKKYRDRVYLAAKAEEKKYKFNIDRKYRYIYAKLKMRPIIRKRLIKLVDYYQRCR